MAKLIPRAAAASGPGIILYPQGSAVPHLAGSPAAAHRGIATWTRCFDAYRICPLYRALTQHGNVASGRG